MFRTSIHPFRDGVEFIQISRNIRVRLCQEVIDTEEGGFTTGGSSSILRCFFLVVVTTTNCSGSIDGARLLPVMVTQTLQ